MKPATFKRAKVQICYATRYRHGEGVADEYMVCAPTPAALTRITKALTKTIPNPALFGRVAVKLAPKKGRK